MNDFNRAYSPGPSGQTMDMSVNEGLRSFMLGVYNKLALGLVVAAALAYVTGNVPAVQQLLYTAGPDGRMSLTLLGMAVQFAPLVLIFGSMFFMKNPTASGTNVLYWLVVATMGASLGWVFLIYTGASVASTFLVTAAAFGGGWFRTGDQGFLSEAGYLTLTGRIKELINRAGEKISPLEIDGVLLKHPAVAEAVPAALPAPAAAEHHGEDALPETGRHRGRHLLSV